MKKIVEAMSKDMEELEKIPGFMQRAMQYTDGNEINPLPQYMFKMEEILNAKCLIGPPQS